MTDEEYKKYFLKAEYYMEFDELEAQDSEKFWYTTISVLEDLLDNYVRIRTVDGN